MRRGLLAIAILCAACASSVVETTRSRIVSVVAPLGTEVACALAAGEVGEHRPRGPAGVWVFEAHAAHDPSLAVLDRDGLEVAQDDDGAPDLDPRAARAVLALDDPAAHRVVVRDARGGTVRYRAQRAAPLELHNGAATATLDPTRDGWWSLEVAGPATLIAAVDSRTPIALVSPRDGRERTRGLEVCRAEVEPGPWAIHAGAGARTLNVRVVPRRPADPLQLRPGASQEGTLAAGEVATFLLELRAPGPIELIARARGASTIDPWLALEAADGTVVARDDDGAGERAARVLRSLGPGRWLVRVGARGAGAFQVEANGPGTRGSPAPLRAGERARVALGPRASQWFALSLDAGPWSFAATSSAGARAALSLFRGRRQVAWSGDGRPIERALEAGEYVVGLADLSGQGGEWTLRARRLRATSEHDPVRLDARGLAWRTGLGVLGARWLAFEVDAGGEWLVEAEGEEGAVDVSVARAGQAEVWGAEGRAIAHLEPGAHIARVEPSAGTQLACRAAPVHELAPDRPARAALDPDGLAVWRVDTGAGGLVRVEVEATCPARLALLDARGRALTGQARFGPGSAAWVERRVHPGALFLRVEAQDRAGVVTARTTWLSRMPGQGPEPERCFAHLRLRPVPRVPVALGRSSEGPGGAAFPDPLADPVQEPARSTFSPGGAWIGVEEVTQRAFESLTGRNPSLRKRPDLPVHGVSQLDALRYCQALTHRAELDPVWKGFTFRLPTEDEWEACARAGSRTPVALPPGVPNRRGFEVRLEEVAWFQSSLPRGEQAGPFAVARLAPNAWGLHDVHGNVAEWCLPGRDLPPPPQGHAPLRGGSWTTDYRGCRVSNRDLLPVTFASPSTGFRVIAVRR